MKKKFIFIALVTFFIACSNQKNEAANVSKAENENALKTLTVDQILAHIEKSVIDSSKNDYPQLSISIDEKEGNKIIFMDSLMPMAGATIIPLSMDKFITGDLTGDGIEDILVPGADEGGASTHLPTFYLFKAIEAKKYSVNYLKFYGSDLGFCKGESLSRGSFYPKYIQSNKLIGESTCYDKSDPNCCPSLKFETILKFDDEKNTFSLVSQKSLK